MSLNYLQLAQDKEYGQEAVTLQRRMPSKDDRSGRSTPYSETVSFFYFNGDTLTQDAGQAAGTLVVAKLKFDIIQNALGDEVGAYGDTSVSFTPGVFTQLKPFRSIAAEQSEFAANSKLAISKAKAQTITSGFQNGEYAIDHELGVIYGVKATSASSLAVNYKIRAVPSFVTAGNGIVEASSGDYIIKYDDAGSGIIYIGKAIPGTATSSATWQIKRMNESSTPDFDVLFADGNAGFDNVWDNRASLSYS